MRGRLLDLLAGLGADCGGFDEGSVSWRAACLCDHVAAGDTLLAAKKRRRTKEKIKVIKQEGEKLATNQALVLRIVVSQTGRGEKPNMYTNDQ